MKKKLTSLDFRSMRMRARLLGIDVYSLKEQMAGYNPWEKAMYVPRWTDNSNYCTRICPFDDIFMKKIAGKVVA